MINARPLFLGISDDSFENFIKIVLLKRPSRRSQVWVDLSSNSKKTKKRNDGICLYVQYIKGLAYTRAVNFKVIVIVGNLF